MTTKLFCVICITYNNTKHAKYYVKGSEDLIISINEMLDIPIYRQIRNQIIHGISSGQLKPGDTLPTVRDLAGSIGLNTMTVSKAYQLLKQEGYIYTDRRNGTKIMEHFDHVSLSHENEMELKRIIGEAKICGYSKEEILTVVSKVYDGES